MHFMPLPWDDIDAQNGLLKEAPKKDFRVYFSRIIAKLDAQSSELPSQAIKFGIRCITLWLENILRA